MDRISNLPDVLIEGILEKLPLLDQVRTSLLSRCWRHRWAKIPSLVIDEEFYRFLSTSKPTRKKRRSNAELHPSEVYINVINSLLVQHIGHLVEFSLFIPYNDGELMPGYHLPVQYVLRNGIARLSLINDNDDYFVLPLFSAVGLEHLRLEMCALRLPPAFHGFPNLVSFFQDCNSFPPTTSNFISSCPVLEVVELNGFVDSDRDLNIRSPKLRSLSLCGEFKSIPLSSAQTMEILKLSYTGSNISSVDLTVLHSMTNLKHLTLGYGMYKILAQCTDFPRFRQMNRLSLYHVCWDDIDVLECMLRLCTSSPNLKQLDITVTISFFAKDDTLEYQSVLKSYRNHDFGNLRTINIDDVRGLKTEMNLIELLLSRSTLLELMSIKVARYVGTSEKLTIVEDVAGFCRLSPIAKIKFLKPMGR